MKRKTKEVYRSAITGRFVSEKFVKKNESVTIKQRVRLDKNNR